jgi:hypothetical protein
LLGFNQPRGEDALPLVVSVRDHGLFHPSRATAVQVSILETNDQSESTTEGLFGQIKLNSKPDFAAFGETEAV